MSIEITVNDVAPTHIMLDSDQITEVEPVEDGLKAGIRTADGSYYVTLNSYQTIKGYLSKEGSGFPKNLL